MHRRVEDLSGPKLLRASNSYQHRHGGGGLDATSLRSARAMSFPPIRTSRFVAFELLDARVSAVPAKINDETTARGPRKLSRPQRGAD